MTEPVELDDASFERDVIFPGQAWAVLFWAQHCAPCHAVERVLAEIAPEYSDVSFGKVEVAANAVTSQRIGVTSAPTIVLFNEGAPVRMLFGVKNRRQITQAIQDAVAVA